jgi:hypothetical protein
LAYADTPAVEREREAYITTHLRWRFPLREGIKILEGALAIGRQADELPPLEARSRMEEVQQQAAVPTSVDEHPLFATNCAWLAHVF